MKAFSYYILYLQMNQIPINKRQEIAVLATAKDQKTNKKVYTQRQVAQMMGVSTATVAECSSPMRLLFTYPPHPIQ